MGEADLRIGPLAEEFERAAVAALWQLRIVDAGHWRHAAKGNPSGGSEPRADFAQRARGWLWTISPGVKCILGSARAVHNKLVAGVYPFCAFP